MELSLLDVRRYAIDERAEVRFGECVIDAKGHVRIPGAEKELRAEDVFLAAESFEVRGEGAPRRLARAALARAIEESFARRGFAAAAHDDE
jgi:hypothetical protein